MLPSNSSHTKTSSERKKMVATASDQRNTVLLMANFCVASFSGQPGNEANSLAYL